MYCWQAFTLASKSLSPRSNRTAVGLHSSYGNSKDSKIEHCVGLVCRDTFGGCRFILAAPHSVQGTNKQQAMQSTV